MGAPTTSTGRSGAPTWPRTSSACSSISASRRPTSSASASAARRPCTSPINHPELVRKLVVSSVSFHPDGDRPENSEAVGEMTVEMIAGTPMEQDYLRQVAAPRQAAGPARQARDLRRGLPRLVRRRHRGDRRPDPDHRGRLRRGQARPRGQVPAVAWRRRQRRLRRRPVLAAGGVPGHHALLRPRPHRAGPGRGAHFLDAPPPAGWSDISFGAPVAGDSSRSVVWCQSSRHRPWRQYVSPCLIVKIDAW